MTSRLADRKGFPEDVRVGLLETDADKAERAISELRHDIEEQLEQLRGELKAIRTIMTGMLISITTGCVLLVANVLLGTLHK